MYTLYCAPGTCALAAHITLEETGADYERKLLDLRQGEHKRPDYLKIHPAGKVPALKLGEIVIVENVAIQYYLAKRFPEAHLAPTDPVGEAKWIATNAWLSNTVQPVFSRIFRPSNYAQSDGAQQEVKEAGKHLFWSMLQQIDQRLANGPWINGAEYTTSDGYALVYFTWGRRAELPIAELPNYPAWRARMLGRSAVRKVLEREQSPLL